MQALQGVPSCRLDNWNRNLRKDLANDMHTGDSTDFCFRLHVDSVGDDLQGNALDVIGDDIVSPSDSSSGTPGLEQRLTCTRRGTVDDAMVFSGTLNDFNDVRKDGRVDMNGLKAFCMATTFFGEVTCSTTCSSCPRNLRRARMAFSSARSG